MTKKLEKPSGEKATWQQRLADELHKPAFRNFTRESRRRDMGLRSRRDATVQCKWNSGYRYLLMVSDVFSKYGWIRPLKDKSGETVAGVLKSIFDEGQKPKFLWVDKGREYNRLVKKLLESEGIHMYSTENEQKSSVVERCNKTMKEKMLPACRRLLFPLLHAEKGLFRVQQRK